MSAPFLHRAMRNASFATGMALVGLLALVALLSLVWTPYPPAAIEVSRKLLLPSAAHWLGTDHLGRDIVSLVMAGARNSVLAGVVAVGTGLGIGVTLGLVASACRGWTEEVLMRIADFTFAFPAILSAILLTSVMGAGIVNAILAIGILNAALFAQITRAAANSVYPREYILAARLSGCTGWRLSLRHVLPNIASVLIVQATIQFATAILAEAALSYLGLGTQPPDASWGRMLNEAQALLFQAPRLAIFPGCAIALAVLGLNLAGDGLRDLLDPRLSRR